MKRAYAWVDRHAPSIVPSYTRNVISRRANMSIKMFLLQMVPCCTLFLYICVISRTLVTVDPKYDVPVTLTAPDLLEIKILWSTAFSLTIWMLVTLISIVLTYNMPHTRLTLREICQTPSIYGLLAVLAYEVSMFGFIYQVYAIELVSTLQLILAVPFGTFLLHSIYQIHVLMSDRPPHDFNKIHLFISLVFNCVMSKHTVCMIITSVYAAANPSSNVMLLFAAIEIIYRLWAAAKYTELIKRSGEALQPDNDGAAQRHRSNDDGRDSTMVVTSNKPKGFHQDISDNPYQYRTKQFPDTSFDKLKSILVACSLNIVSFKHFKCYFLTAGFGTLVYLMLCYVMLYYLSVVGEFSHLIYAN